MPGEQYKGKLDSIMKTIAAAGFAGIEPETSFFGALEDPVRMKEVLRRNGLELVALCHVEDWKEAGETREEALRAEKWMDFLAHFPETIYLLVQMPGENRKDLEERQKNLLQCINSIAARATDRNITCSFHPNSPVGSIFRTADDYEILLEGMDTDLIKYCPDVGHIAKGGMDPLAIIRRYREAINLVHYKDIYADGRWAETGKGIINFAGITKYLKETGYDGWIVMEDECDEAISDPDGLTMRDGLYIDTHIRPLL